MTNSVKNVVGRFRVLRNPLSKHPVNPFDLLRLFCLVNRLSVNSKFGCPAAAQLLSMLKAAYPTFSCKLRRV